MMGALQLPVMTYNSARQEEIGKPWQPLPSNSHSPPPHQSRNCSLTPSQISHQAQSTASESTAETQSELVDAVLLYLEPTLSLCFRRVVGVSV